MKPIIAFLLLGALAGCGSPEEPDPIDPPFLLLDVVNNSGINVDVDANGDTALVVPAERAMIPVQEPFEGNRGLLILVVWQDSVNSQAELFHEGARQGERYEVVVAPTTALLFRR